MKKIKLLFLLFFICRSLFVFAQPDRWQQRIQYTMDVNLNVVSNRLNGTEKIEYVNNSPDTLDRIFFHLYWNAFQPNSEMDIRSRELGNTILGEDKNGNKIYDWDYRVRDRISTLAPDEIGYDSVDFVKINGVAQQLIYHETILEVKPDKKILPNSKTLLDVAFRTQVPIQIRRSGRDNTEGVRYSMSQWYPKIVEYDYQGWNANPYIAREFYGVWGNFDIKISIDKNYMVAATGVLQNANEIGYGYESADAKILPNKNETNEWHFKGENIHDFVWAADDNYKHISKKVRTGLVLHAFYKAGDASTDSSWNNVLWAAEKVLPFIEKKFGKYPYPQYSFIQGGDGGMEYAMATLIKSASLGTVFHEWMHSWYQQILGTNESLYPWMDEGFATYAEGQVSAYYYNNLAQQSPFLSNAAKRGIAQYTQQLNLNLPLYEAGSYTSYFSLSKSPYEEAMITHADHYNTNYAYERASYSKGAVFLTQLGYIISDSLRDKVLMEYYNQWKFKHPNANDFIRVAEKLTGIELQWYKEYWINSTQTIDYAIGNIDVDNNKKTYVTLKRIGKMPMPVDVLFTFKDGTKELHYIPLSLMYGTKPNEDTVTRIVHDEWKWVAPEYKLYITKSIKDIKYIEIDPSQRMADINRSNNKLTIPDY